MRNCFSSCLSYRTILIICCLFTIFWGVSNPISAQQNDSLSSEMLSAPWYRHRLVKISNNTVPLFAIGLFFYERDKGIRTFRNSYIPSFRSHYDDFLQYVPISTVFSLKFFGVKGRSSWKEWLVSNGFGAVSLFLLVNGIKYGTQKLRPDNSAYNSFPSGHTAMAFYGATLLHHEYGRTLSPWIGVGGYVAAIGTAFGRVLNNRHWFSDVLAGAAIGLFSAQMGYYLSDLIFRKYHTDGFQPTIQDHIVDKHQSFIGLSLGLPSGWQFGKVNSQTSLRVHAYHSIQLEGVFFFHPRWGVGSFFSLYNGQLEILPSRSSIIMHSEDNLSKGHANLRNWKWGAQLWGNTPLPWNARLFVALSVGGGRFNSLSVQYHTESQPNIIQDLTVTPDFCPFYGLEISLAKKIDRKWGVKAFAEFSYEHIPVDVKKNSKNSNSTQTFRKFVSFFSLQPGISLVLFPD